MIIRTTTATVYYPIAKRGTNSICRRGRVRSMCAYVLVRRKARTGNEGAFAGRKVSVRLAKTGRRILGTPPKPLPWRALPRRALRSAA